MLKDIKKVSPEKDNKFFVDTNVWYWTTYAASKTFPTKGPQDYQIEYYPNFIESALSVNATLYSSPLVLAEISTLIERTEFEIYKAYHPGDSRITLKLFRNIKSERDLVVNEIKTAWNSIISMSKELPITIDQDTSKGVIATIESSKVDGYDALYNHIMEVNNIDNIITDDKNFRQIERINTYTCYK